MDELTTFIAGIDFPNEDKSKSNRRMECMLCAPGDAVKLRLEPSTPYDENAVAIFSERGLRELFRVRFSAKSNDMLDSILGNCLSALKSKFAEI